VEPSGFRDNEFSARSSGKGGTRGRRGDERAGVSLGDVGYMGVSSWVSLREAETIVRVYVAVAVARALHRPRVIDADTVAPNPPAT